MVAIKPAGVFSRENRTTKNGIGTVNKFSPDGIESIQVEVNNSFEDVEESELTDKLTDTAIDFVKSNKMFFKRFVQGLEFSLSTPDAGGNSVGSIFSIDLFKVDGKRKLFLALRRDEDPGSNTACMYWIPCPKNKYINEEFKNIVKQGICELIYDGAYVLRDRAKLRRNFNELCKGSLGGK